MTQKLPGQYMAREIKAAASVFYHAARARAEPPLSKMGLESAMAFFTVARGSSDAVANILSYEFMRELGISMTSLPPSVFSIGRGIEMKNTTALVISQSGASEDLVRSADGIVKNGGFVISITNDPSSAVAAASHRVVDIQAGPELAVPATKTVIGSIAAGLRLLGELSPHYQSVLAHSIDRFCDLQPLQTQKHHALCAALFQAQDVYVVGRDTGFGAAQEVALKIKETCAIHAEAYSASEVLHGPLELACDNLLVLILDTGLEDADASIKEAEARFRSTGSQVHVLRPEIAGLTPASAAAALLCHLYPVILQTSVDLGLDPDRPQKLSKVTKTR